MIYLSEFEIDRTLKRNKNYDIVHAELLRIFDENGLPYFRSNKFTSYEEIERKLNRSDIVIALIDEYWTSSTWKMHEVMWPIEAYTSMGGIKLDKKHRTIFLYWTEAVKNYPLLNISGEVVNVDSIPAIKVHLEKHYYKELR